MPIEASTEADTKIRPINNGSSNHRLSSGDHSTALAGNFNQREVHIEASVEAGVVTQTNGSSNGNGGSNNGQLSGNSIA